MTTAKYTLSTGQQLNVVTRTVIGIAGESAIIVTFEMGGLTVNLDFLKGLLKPEDYNDIDEYICQIRESNYESSLALCN